MDAVKLIRKLQEAGIKIWLKDGVLKYKAMEGVFSDELKAEVSAAKKEIIEFIEAKRINESRDEEIKGVARSEKLHLSYGQKWLWLTSQIEEQSTAFHIPAAFRIKGEIDVSTLEKALNEIVRRHEILRTVYTEYEGDAYQIILPEMQMKIKWEEEQKYTEEEVKEYIEKDLKDSFDLSKGPLFRARLLQMDACEYAFVMVFHHIICDNQSMNIFLMELMSLYDTYAEGKESNLGKLKIQYADYSVWQEERLKSGVKDIQVNFWKEKLKDIVQIPEIEGDYSRPEKISSESNRIYYEMPEEILIGLKKLGKRAGCSLYVTLLSAFHILLHQYSGRQTIITGSPVVGRAREELLPMIGLFFNTVVVRTEIQENMDFFEYLRTVGKEAASAFANQDVPFELLTDELAIQRKANCTPIFQVLFNMYTAHYKGKLKGAELEVLNEEMIGGQNINSKFDITLLAIEYEEGLRMDFSFKADLYKKETVEWLVHQFQILTECIVKNTPKLIKDFSSLEPIQREKACIDHPYIPFTKEETNQSVIKRFDHMVSVYPEHTAVEMNKEKISYQKLQDISVILEKQIMQNKVGYPRLSKSEKIRYGRQMILEGWGIHTQEKLKSLTVLAAGAGGSGSPVIMQLALLGVGTIILCDFDDVELSNLNRQVLHDESRIGMNKAESAALSVHNINPNVKTIVIKEKINEENIFRITGNAAAIFDNVDSIDAKFAISKCAVAKQIPHVISSMIERSSYAAIFHTPYTPCFHCCYDYDKLETIQELRKSDSGFQKVANCVASPSLFLSAGFAVNETLKILLGFENPAYNKYFLFNNQASIELPKTRGYQIVTYPFSEHFFITCKKYGFDWETGFSGRLIEEIPMEKDPDCKLCRTLDRNSNDRKDETTEKKWEQNYESCEPEVAALLIHYSAGMVAGILGSLRAGLAFVPLDSEYPLDRLNFIVEDTDAHCIIHDTENEELAEEIRKAVNHHITLINIDHVLDEYNKNGMTESLEDFSKSDKLAYILYTSGSMGKPKGVMQTHRNVLHYIMNYTNTLHIATDDRVSLIPSFIFSAAMMDVFASLTNGATLCLHDFKKEGPAELAKWLSREKITVYHSVPTVFRHFIASMEAGTKFPKLRVIDFGGEAVSVGDVALFKTYFHQNCSLVNGLGATELNVIRQYVLHMDTEVEGNVVPVGYQVEDTEIILLNEDGTKAGYNQTGEIIIKCDYLSPGYWELEEDTKKAFRKDESGSNIFYTGDLGRIRPDGCMEHLGRKDLQIKIRGIRVEPTEIEACLLKIQGIKEAAVTLKTGEGESRHLVAYLTFLRELDSDVIKLELKEMLPSYMIPSYFITLDKMPLTATGKISRKELPEIAKEFKKEAIIAEPENDVQKLLASIWEKVLNIKKVGILDNFSDLGGDSIKAIKVNAELSKYGYTLKLQDIVEKQTIKALSERVLLRQEKEIDVNLKRAPLTATQRDYFRYNKHEDKHIWSVSAFLCNGEYLEEEALRKTIDIIAESHDALRLTFKEEDGSIIQYCKSIQDKNLYGYYSYDFTMLEEPEDRMTKESALIQKKHNLENGPLMQCAVFKTKKCDYFFISIHHFICDFLSAGILIQDFTQVYLQNRNHENCVYPFKTDSFLRWSNNMNQEAFSKEMIDRLPYWLAITQESIQTIPVDFPCEQRLIKDTMEISGSLPADCTKSILEAMQEKYQASAEIIILTVLGRAIKKWCKISKVRVEFETNGREGYGGTNVARTVGWFATSFPILLDCQKDSFAENVEDLKLSRNAMPGSGADFYILRDITVPEKYPEYDLHTPKEIFCNYFGVRDFAQADESKEEKFQICNIPVKGSMAQDADAGHKLCFIISITDGKLCVAIQFSMKEYRRESIQQLLECYIEEFEKK